MNKHNYKRISHYLIFTNNLMLLKAIYMENKNFNLLEIMYSSNNKF